MFSGNTCPKRPLKSQSVTPATWTVLVANHVANPASVEARAAAAVARRQQPVDGCGEDPQPLVPDARRAHRVGFRDGGNGLIGARAGTEGEHGHHPLAELAFAHEERGCAGYPPGSQRADHRHADQVDAKRDVVDGPVVHSVPKSSDRVRLRYRMMRMP